MPPFRPKKIQIYGLPRTCTNVTEKILRANFYCPIFSSKPPLRLYQSGDWKHGLCKYWINNPQELQKHNTYFIVCTKNPIDWLWSLYYWDFPDVRDDARLELDQQKEFLNSISKEYSCRKGETKIGIDGQEFKPIEAFNKLMPQWLDLFPGQQRVFQVKFEDLIENQESVILKIRNHFQIKMKVPNPVKVPQYITPHRRPRRDKFEKRFPQWNPYINRLIAKRLDKKIVRQAGYKWPPEAY